MPEPTHDIVLYGATSFVGQITARYLLDRHGVGGELSWAIAGRSEKKLQQLRSSLGPAAADLDVIVADAADEGALSRMVDQARVVCSTVGPYALYGSLLVQLCAATGTAYCDLTGEVHWVREMIDAHQQTAETSGAHLVPSCGFDSIPSDMGVHHLQQVALARHGEPCTRVKMRVKAAKGGASGGTIASMMNIASEVIGNRELRRVLANPYSLAPEGQRKGVTQPNVATPQFDADFDSHVAPFVMAAINTRVVHRSNALLDHAYGTEFTYDEAMLTGSGVKGRAMAIGITGGVGAFMAGAAVPPTRWAIEKVVPSPGEGPSPEAQEAGYWKLLFVGHTAGGEEVRTGVTGDMDPGYGSTAKMLGEAAACLAQDVPERTPTPAGGFWTPASLLGDDLVQRLQDHAGVTFTEIE